jgi:quinol-cytochrome oxidoreductase complex cytochrome b subunit
MRSWVARIWADIKASTDPALLAVLRFLGLLYGPIDRRLPIDQALRKALRRRLPAYVGWRHALGGVTYLLFIILVVTGVSLALYYRPSAQEAYPSIQHIISDVSFGWLIRDLHVWSANLIVLALLAHMARVFFAAAYKPPRETSWFVGLLLLFVVLTFGATGYLLPWDQWAYWTVTIVLDTVERVPVLGGPLVRALRGDVVVSGGTLSRFFALHVIILPWIAFALLGFHFMVVRRHGIAPPAASGEEDGDTGVPFFPDHLLRSFIVSVLVLAIVISLAALYPRPVGDPASSFRPPDELVSTWIVVDVALALVRHLGSWGIALFALVGLLLALLPLFDRRPERRLGRRPIAAALGLVFFGGFLLAWAVGRQVRSLPHDVRTGSSVTGEPVEGSEESAPLRDLGPERILPERPERPNGEGPPE